MVRPLHTRPFTLWLAMTSVYDRVACMGTSFLAKQREGVAGEFNSEKKKVVERMYLSATR